MQGGYHVLLANSCVGYAMIQTHPEAFGIHARFRVLLFSMNKLNCFLRHQHGHINGGTLLQLEFTKLSMRGHMAICNGYDSFFIGHTHFGT